MAKKHRKTLFGPLLALCALHLLPVTWQASPNMSFSPVFGQASPNREIDEMMPVDPNMISKDPIVSGRSAIGEVEPTAAEAARKRARVGGGENAKRMKSDPTATCILLDSYGESTQLQKISGQVYLGIKTKGVTISGSAEGVTTMGDNKDIPVELKKHLALTDPKISWTPTGDRSSAAGIWIHIATARDWLKAPKNNQANMTMLILFKLNRDEYEKAEKVEFTPKDGPNETAMKVPGVPGGHVQYPKGMLWTAQVKQAAPASASVDEALRFVYFSSYRSPSATNKAAQRHMTLSDDRCETSSVRSNRNFSYRVTLEMNEIDLTNALNEGHPTLLLNGDFCQLKRNILLYSDHKFDDVFSRRSAGTAGNSFGTNKRKLIRITLTIPSLYGMKHKDLKNHVYSSVASYTIDTTDSIMFKPSGNVNYQTFTAYQLM
eukprot:GHVS01101884.1.p1 GENE.GHVS01101884.1~~GHVS01101884.1.p1  ORF type:complete len:433 (+),score=37.78 GHVS01101884.1:245-1543(+)